MANTKLSALTLATTLASSDLFYIAQGGTTSKSILYSNVASQLAALTQTLTNKTLTAATFATSMTGSYLTASELLITDASKNIVSAAVATYPSLTELSYVKGVTSALQTQINTKGTVTTVSVATANGFSGSVANATTTPAITIVAGAITPTSVNGLTLTSSTGVLTITNAKTLTVSNSLTLAGTDGKGIDVGAATSRKILVGDGSNMILSTETYAVPGTSGNVLTSDGTNWTSATPVASGTDGWTAGTGTWTYASVDAPTGVITVPTDATTIYSVGMKVKFTQTTVKYGIITAIAATSMTIYTGTDYTLANAAITSPFYSTSKAPLGFPLDPTKWTVRVTDTTDRSQASPVTDTWYNLGTTAAQISIPIGVWNVNYQVTIHYDRAAVVQTNATLSTANNSESDAELTTNFQTTVAFGGGSLYKSKTLTLASKTLHYLNTKTANGGSGTLYNRNGTSGAPLILEARCAFL